MKRIPRQVIILGIVSFFADVSSEMIYPILPLYLIGVLRAPASVLGLIEGAAAVVVGILALSTGWLSDRGGKRVRFVQCGYGLPILGKGLLCLATGWPMVLAGRLLDRTGKGIRGTARDAILSDAVQKEDLGRVFGFHRACDTAGAFVGVLIAAAVLGFDSGAGTGSSYRSIFLTATICAALSFISTLFIRDNKASAARDQKLKSELSSNPTNAMPRSFWVLILAFTVFGVANSSDTFLLLRAKEIGFSPLFVVFAYALYNFVYAVGSYPAGVMADRFGRSTVVTIGWLIYAVVYLVVALVSSAAPIWGILAVYGLYMALTDGVGKALLVAEVPNARRGAALGLFYGSSAFAALGGNLLAGVLWDTVSEQAPFIAGSAVALVAIILLRYSGVGRASEEKSF